MANDLSAFNAESWSSRLVKKLDQINVMLPLVNRDWEGDLRQNKTVNIRTPGSITMSSYTRGTTISYQDLTPTKEQFTVNDGEYFAFEVDDIDKAQSDLDAMDIYTKRAVVALNNQVESKILGAYVNTPANNIISAATAGSSGAATATVSGGRVTAVGSITGGSGYTYPPIVKFTGGGGQGATATATISGGAITAVTVNNGGAGYATAPTVSFVGGVPLTLDSSTSTTTGIYALFTRARAIQSNNNVPATPGARWAIVDPDTTSLLLQDTDHFVRAGELGDKIVQYGVIGDEQVARTAMQAPGFIGMIAGYLVYETPHTPKTGTQGSTGVKRILFGDKEAISYAAQITEIEALRLQTTFANAVRGLLLHDTFVPAESTNRLVMIEATW